MFLASQTPRDRSQPLSLATQSLLLCFAPSLSTPRNHEFPLKDLKVIRCLASGPNLSVFLASDRSTRQQFALKKISLHDNRENAKQELAIAHKIPGGGPHIIAYKAAFVDDDSLYLVMEECAGGDLHSFLESQRDQRLSENDALRLWEQVVLGVQFLHNHGIARRDLSLKNVLLDKHQRVAIICDFGLSTIVTNGELCSGRVGIGYYMAPIVAAKEPHDAVQADVWSLGIMLFVLLTRSPLVQTVTPGDPVFQALERVGVRGILRHWRMDTLISPTTVALLQQLL